MFLPWKCILSRSCSVFFLFIWLINGFFRATSSFYTACFNVRRTVAADTFLEFYSNSSFTIFRTLICGSFFTLRTIRFSSLADKILRRPICEIDSMRSSVLKRRIMHTTVLLLTFSISILDNFSLFPGGKLQVAVRWTMFFLHLRFTLSEFSFATVEQSNSTDT